LPRRKSHRGDSVTNKLPMTKRMPGGSDTQKDAAPRQVFITQEGRGVSGGGDRVNAIAVIHADQSCPDDAEGEQPLEDACSFAPIGCGEAFAR